MKVKPQFYCSKCETNVKQLGEYDYKLKSEIWLRIANSSNLLCLGCLELLLGRRLKSGDFSDDPINWKPFKRVRKSARLLNRLDKRNI